MGIDPQHFNLRAGLHSTLAIAAVSAMMSAIIGVAAYLKQSPLPNERGLEGWEDRENRESHENDRIQQSRENRDERGRDS